MTAPQSTPVRLPMTEWIKLGALFATNIVVVVGFFVRANETVKNNTKAIERQGTLIVEVKREADETRKEHAAILLRIVQQLGRLEGRIEGPQSGRE